MVGLSSVLNVELFWLWFGKKISCEDGQNWPFLFLLDTLCLGEGLRLGEPEAKFSELSDPPRRSIASPRHTCKSCFVFSLPLILAIIHWINGGS